MLYEGFGYWIFSNWTLLYQLGSHASTSWYQNTLITYTFINWFSVQYSQLWEHQPEAEPTMTGVEVIFAGITAGSSALSAASGFIGLGA